ncbi:hypothetical protein NKCBBBOE_00952 [Pseudarthrobacter sp. MM222]|nr:hypothetical protein NKCBBBOE_00952 [Pseudarthrobacter sp. MM222]
MKTNLAVFAVASAALVLSGCAAPSATSPTAPVVTPVTTSTSTPSASPSPTAPRSARGNLIKKVGQPASLKLASGELTTSFVLTKMTIDAPCTAPYAQPSENGHFVALTFDVETTADLAKDINQFVWFGGQSWKLIADTGTTYNGSLDTSPAYGCLNDEERIPSEIGPAEKVTGTIVLDVPAASGTLVFEPAGSGGWEWTFPAK